MEDGKKRIKPALALDPVLPTRLRLAPSNASVFLEAFGQTVPAWIWLRQAMTARHG